MVQTGRGRPRLGAWLLTLTLTAALVGVGGCWDRQELENLGFVVYVGLDAGPKDDLLVTFRIVRPAGYSGGVGAGAGGGSEGGKANQSSIVTTVEAPSVLVAETVAGSYIRRRLVLNQSSAVIVGLPLAEKGMWPYVDEMVRHREIRRTAMLFVTAPDARVDFEKAQPPLDTNPVSFLENMRFVQRTDGWIPNSTVQTVMAGLESPTMAATAALASYSPQSQSDQLLHQPLGPDRSPLDKSARDLPRTGTTNPVNVFGTVVFRGQQAVGTLDGQQTVVFNMLTGDLRRTVFTLPDPIQPSANDNLIMTAARKPTVRVDVRDPVPEVRVTVPLNASLQFDGGGADYAMDQKKARVLENAVDQDLQQRAMAIVDKAQTQWRSDIFGFGNSARGQFRTDRQMLAYDWTAAFPRAKVQITFRMHLDLTGPQLKAPVPGRSLQSSANATGPGQVASSLGGAR